MIVVLSGGPLRQRLSLLESFVAESDLNSQDASFADAVDFVRSFAWLIYEALYFKIQNLSLS